jgi:hypothetical protein
LEWRGRRRTEGRNESIEINENKHMIERFKHTRKGGYFKN